MRREEEPGGRSVNTAFIDEPNFYRLGFASQIMVWAMRKRLHHLAHGASEANVLEAFRVAGLDDIHAALMSIVNLLLCRPSHRVQLHNVACAGLSPHEISLLNALAYRQRGDFVESERHMRQLFCVTAARLLQPAVVAIVNGLDAGGLCLTAVADDDTVAPSARLSVALH